MSCDRLRMSGWGGPSTTLRVNGRVGAGGLGYTYVKTVFETVQMNCFAHEEVPHGNRQHKLGLD